MKKVIVICVAVVLALTAILSIVLCNGNGFDRLKAQRESVAGMIKNGDLAVQSNGLVVLPDEMKKLSDSGECLLVEFDGQTAIYFYSFRGILESSKGYIYVTDEIAYENYIDVSAYDPSPDFVNVVELDSNWYSCSTD